MPINSSRYRYGTAGFRMPASLMDHVATGMGLVAASLASKHYPQAVGVVFTASHNPVDDNGIKMVGPEGEMVGEEWERLAEEIVNGDLNAHGTNPRGTIIVARDTRPSGPRLVGLFEEAVKKVGGNVADAGILTTPQLHHLVWTMNKYELPMEQSLQKYFDHLHSIDKLLLNRNEPIPVTVDCANGVGMLVMEQLTLSVAAFSLINCGEGELNAGCGADYVKMTGQKPANAPSNVSLGASLDGDADRLILWNVDSAGRLNMIDGDRIACLLARHLLQSGCSVAVVQTAYANGASTDYLINNGIRMIRTNTGVKNLHLKAHGLLEDGLDAVVYFEANGHGTVLFNPICQHPLQMIMNHTIGDAIADLLAVIYVVQSTRISTADILNMYSDIPSLQVKIPVKDRSMFVSKSDNETVLVAPEGLQTAIDEVCRVYNGRAFVRPSGTEPILRLYCEGEKKEEMAGAIGGLLAAYC